MTADTLAIVFGASGRLGARLLPLLTEEPVMVLGTIRGDEPTPGPPGLHWMRLDVTNADERPHRLDTLAETADAHRHTVLVDLLLDRRTVTTMRSSIAEVTSCILRIHQRRGTTFPDQPTSLVSASTTATLAPRLYQTPYGLAKRRQLARYAASGIPATAFLLPSLADEPDDAPTDRAAPHWTYTEAADHLVHAITRHATTGDSSDQRFHLVIPDHPATPSSDRRRTRSRHAARRLLPTHLALALGRGDSPTQHREASHQRLALTPRCLRRHLDHHQAPPLLVRHLERSLSRPVTIVSPTSLS